MSNHFIRCSEFIRSLYSEGVRHAVISPGSRSAPLTSAFANHPGFSKNIILDERSAAFTALGIGKESGIPAVLVCTSGTALAGYYPAVTEARQSGVPLIVLSADRPPFLRGTGSSQTIDQIKFFGSYAVFFHEAGEPSHENTDLKRITYAAKQAVADSVRIGGAAHINFPFRKPLEPGEEELKTEIEKNAQQVSLFKKQKAPVSKNIIPSESLVQIFNHSKKPLIIAGPADPSHALSEPADQLAGSLNAPVIAEPGSGIRVTEQAVSGYEQFLRNDEILKKLAPDLVIRFGDQPFTKSVSQYLEKFENITQIHFSGRHSWQNCLMSANEKIALSINDRFILSSLSVKSGTEWINAWKSESEKALNLKNDELKSVTVLTDGHIFSHFSDVLNEEWNVMLSNSFPVRDMALFGESRPGQFVNRGAAGIDGIISTAFGIAVSSNRPMCCMVGDLAFLHDSNALLSLKKAQVPVLIVVINNGGGTIFRMLPIYRRKEIYEQYFETPQNVDIGSLAKAHDLDYQKVETPGELKDFDPKSLTGKPLILECVTNADESMNLRKKLWEF